MTCLRLYPTQAVWVELLIKDFIENVSRYWQVTFEVQEEERVMKGRGEGEAGPSNDFRVRSGAGGRKLLVQAGQGQRTGGGGGRQLSQEGFPAASPSPNPQELSSEKAPISSNNSVYFSEAQPPTRDAFRIPPKLVPPFRTSGGPGSLPESEELGMGSGSRAGQGPSRQL